MITVAIDNTIEEARPWIEAVTPTHPSVIDLRQVVPDLYNMVNVPTVTWIDEEGRIARPNDVTFTDDRYLQYTGLPSGPHIAALRAWVRGERPAMTPAEIRRHQVRPTDAEQLGRTHLDLALWLEAQGRHEAALRHLALADEVAPHDFMHRRGTMRLRGLDPLGPDYREIVQQARDAGIATNRPLPRDTLPPLPDEEAPSQQT